MAVVEHDISSGSSSSSSRRSVSRLAWIVLAGPMRPLTVFHQLSCQHSEPVPCCVHAGVSGDGLGSSSRKEKMNKSRSSASKDKYTKTRGGLWRGPWIAGAGYVLSGNRSDLALFKTAPTDTPVCFIADDPFQCAAQSRRRDASSLASEGQPVSSAQRSTAQHSPIGH